MGIPFQTNPNILGQQGDYNVTTRRYKAILQNRTALV
jgi:hypothetical protein